MKLKIKIREFQKVEKLELNYKKKNEFFKKIRKNKFVILLNGNLSSNNINKRKKVSCEQREYY